MSSKQNQSKDKQSGNNSETIKNSPFPNSTVTSKDNRNYVTGFKSSGQKQRIVINSKKN